MFYCRAETLTTTRVTETCKKNTRLLFSGLNSTAVCFLRKQWPTRYTDRRTLSWISFPPCYFCILNIVHEKVHWFNSYVFFLTDMKTFRMHFSSKLWESVSASLPTPGRSLWQRFRPQPHHQDQSCHTGVWAVERFARSGNHKRQWAPASWWVSGQPGAWKV